MNSYKQIVNYFTTAAQLHVGVQSFAHGSLDYLDSSAQNIAYPYVFLRPMTSTGLVDNTRTLSFELYALDVPKLSTESPVDIMSNMERTLYDIISYFNRGPLQQEIGITVNNIIPTLEAFNDRAYGWVGNIDVFEQGVWNYCTFPKLT